MERIEIDVTTGVCASHPWAAPTSDPTDLTIDKYKAAIVSVLDTSAQERRYDNAVSIATYVNSTNLQWAAEATAFVAWRDAVWGYAYTELAKVERGARAQPSVEDFISELPPLLWPQ